MSTTIHAETTKHLSDLVAADKHILEAVESQLSTSAVSKIPQAKDILSKTAAMLRRHIADLDAMNEAHDSELKAGLKKFFTNVLGNLAGAYNHMRGEGATRAVRDTYTAMALLNASLLALKTYGLTVKNTMISKLAYDQLADLCPLMEEYNKTIPYVVAQETAMENNVTYDSAVPQRVCESTQKLWS